uniref:Uncharacterized protein n=1 Tax=Sphenodon punctatus TaxID=8508 RepID=A0A8D0GSD0_SPHPU
MTRAYLTEHRFLINEQKSLPIPSRRIEHLGVILDSERDKIFITHQRQEKIRKGVLSLITNTSLRLKTLAALLGLLVSCIQQVTWARCHLRPLQRLLRPWQTHLILFIRELVRNLFNEGNDAYREGDWGASLNHYTEALSIAEYANSEEINISNEIQEKLHVNRIACYSNMGLHEKVLEDCERVLRLNENNFRALYRKSKALSELGKYKAAYDAVAKCSLAVPQDESVIKLTQEVAQKLGLKIRKAYVRAKSSNSSVEDIESDLSKQQQETLSSLSSSSSNFAPEVSNDLSPLPVPLQVEKSSVSSVSLVNGGSVAFSMPEGCLDCGDGDDILGEELDDLLDSVHDPNESVMQTTIVRGAIPTASVAPSIPFSTPLLGTLSVGAGFVPATSFSEMYSQPLTSSLENFCSSLNSFSISDSNRGKK